MAASDGLELLQQTLDDKREELKQVASNAGRSGWLAAAAEERGTEQLYAALERQVQQPEFAEELARSQQFVQQQHGGLQAAAAGAAAGAPGAAGGAAAGGAAGRGGEVLSQDWWELRDDGELRVSEQTGDYILVERDDVVRALAAFIAEYIVSLPEARSMEPRELQRAVVATMAELRKGRVRRLLDWAKVLYRLGAVGYAGFTAFSNPWLAKAVLAALWSCLRFMSRFVLPIPV